MPPKKINTTVLGFRCPNRTQKPLRHAPKTRPPKPNPGFQACQKLAAPSVSRAPAPNKSGKNLAVFLPAPAGAPGSNFPPGRSRPFQFLTPAAVPTPDYDLQFKKPSSGSPGRAMLLPSPATLPIGETPSGIFLPPAEPARCCRIYPVELQPPPPYDLPSLFLVVPVAKASEVRPVKTAGPVGGKRNNVVYVSRKLDVVITAEPKNDFGFAIFADISYAGQIGVAGFSPGCAMIKGSRPRIPKLAIVKTIRLPLDCRRLCKAVVAHCRPVRCGSLAPAA